MPSAGGKGLSEEQMQEGEYTPYALLYFGFYDCITYSRKYMKLLIDKPNKQRLVTLAYT